MFDWLIVGISKYSILKTSIFGALIIITLSLLAVRISGRTLRTLLAVIVLTAISLAVIEVYAGVFGPERGTFQYQVNSFIFSILLIPPTNIILAAALAWIVTRPSDTVIRRKSIVIPAIAMSLLFEWSFLAVINLADQLQNW